MRPGTYVIAIKQNFADRIKKHEKEFKELKDEIILRARERLASMEDFLNFVDGSTAKKIVLASAALATFEAIEEAIP